MARSRGYQELQMKPFLLLLTDLSMENLKPLSALYRTFNPFMIVQRKQESARNNSRDNVIESEFPDAALEITEEEILQASDGVFSTCEMLYAEVVMNIAEEHGVFVDDLPDIALQKPASNARDVDLGNYDMWHNHIQKAEACDIGVTGKVPRDTGAVQNIESHTNPASPDASGSVASIITHSPTSPDCPDFLNKDQRVAFTIVANHLAGKNPVQLLMQIHGQGGTGKTKLIHAITDLFIHRGCVLLRVRSEEALSTLGPLFPQAKVCLALIHGFCVLLL
ncbi:hypothetical protein DFJ58DRAFT_837197 [Suillus subalutaceus]|uniref:uncharacterized protein n=1 Tax=Suillus subalutaceus TaxID=48586 RepID=UPI001B867179|nr:uncharacterized protein DFJ58DRAFT_837197 [Suillus subalutaceus]KAG1871224.1 hypothetical protein DFJ58DRAFT_837197 [Suillus subalutaceus]